MPFLDGVYLAENLDAQKLEAALLQYQEFYEKECEKTIAQARAKLQGQQEALARFREMLHCSNYVKDRADTRCPKT